MALIQCYECSREISESATSCPHCGAPVRVKAVKKGDYVPYTAQEVAVMLSKKTSTSHLLHLVLTIITAGVWVIVWILVAASNGSENARIDKEIQRGKRV